jgi:hypothetical protein
VPLSSKTAALPYWGSAVSPKGLIASLTKDGDDVDTLKVVLETLLMLFHPDENSPEASEEIALWLADQFSQVRSPLLCTC